MGRLRRNLLVISLITGVLSVPEGAAQAAARQSDDQDAISAINSVVVGGKAAINTRTGQGRELGPLRTVRSLVDAATDDVLGTGTLRLDASTEGPADLRSCIKNGDNRKLQTFDHFDRYASTRRGSIHFQYHPYRITAAREVEGAPTTQWEVCSVGGGQLADHRLRRVGTGIALADSENFRRIGYSWRTGSTPENYTLGLGFQVKKGPVGISASLTQKPADKLLGSHRGPWNTFMDTYDRNAVNAWWQDNCIGRWYRCWPKSGSHDFQGAIAHGLWEFPAGTEPSDVAFYFVLYAGV
ncbi:hypothetical protein GCM10009547_35200 [Sporichthya brevicatena]|uniref:Secreted protein n=1 Tax=Sporichthya brevicatena TaxID=171442 RepID=A0ABN1H459_9ACTN